MLKVLSNQFNGQHERIWVVLLQFLVTSKRLHQGFPGTDTSLCSSGTITEIFWEKKKKKFPGFLSFPLILYKGLLHIPFHIFILVISLLGTRMDISKGNNSL